MTKQTSDALRDMVDQFGRRVEYLRISVTDKCNLRCVYCMPMEGLPWLKRDELLTYEEIEQIVRTMAGMGLKRVRITGGEPLVRRAQRGAALPVAGASLLVLTGALAGLG